MVIESNQSYARSGESGGQKESLRAVLPDYGKFPGKGEKLGYERGFFTGNAGKIL